MPSNTLNENFKLVNSYPSLNIKRGIKKVGCLRIRTVNFFFIVEWVILRECVLKLYDIHYIMGQAAGSNPQVTTNKLLTLCC